MANIGVTMAKHDIDATKTVGDGGATQNGAQDAQEGLFLAFCEAFSACPLGPR